VLAKLLERERLVVATALVVASGLAWFWLARMSAGGTAAVSGSGMDMPGMDMPGMDMLGMAGDGALSPSFGAYFPSTALMWFVMMVAMMLPSASPMILIYDSVARRNAKATTALAPTFVFAGTYVAVWAGFSLLAAALQWALAAQGLISADKLALRHTWVAGGLLVAAGLYQATPLKQACLSRCRSPLSFLMTGWRPGWRGAIRLGLSHGLFCLGCCWLLMTLLFAGGVMNPALVVVLALVVLIEKVAPAGKFVSLAIGGLAVGAGLWLAVAF
jgi:predicted metal-binding membrane protein